MPPDMQYRSYRLSILSGLMLIVGTFLLTTSCEKETKYQDPPQLKFRNDSGFITKDTLLKAGTRVRIGIEAIAANHNITFMQVSCNTGQKQIYLDSGMNCTSLKYNLTIVKSVNQKEKWTFIVMDKDRNKDSIQLTLYRSSSDEYGDIKSYDDVVLGAQSNTSEGSFYSLRTGTPYNLSTAYMNQASVDMIYYFGPYNATLSSPNESEAPGFFTGIEGIANWLIKNETRYDTTLITSSQFDEAKNDSLLIAAYEPTAGKRKAKYVTVGSVYSFITQAGKIGLIKVVQMEPGEVGYLRFSVKIQK